LCYLLLQESVVLRYLLCAAGDITTSDVDLAAASSGMVVGFNLNPDEAVLSHAKRLGEYSARVSGFYGLGVMGGGASGYGGGLQPEP
jgi:translation initiation factor IF-2